MTLEPEYREGLDELAVHYKRILELLGEDPDREGLQKTPMRVAKAMQVLTRGYEMDAHKVLTDALFKEDYNHMVIVKDSSRSASIICCLCTERYMWLISPMAISLASQRLPVWLISTATDCKYRNA